RRATAGLRLPRPAGRAGPHQGPDHGCVANGDGDQTGAPAPLDRFCDGVEPDRALLAFRRLSESLSSSGWFLKMLRDSGLAAKSVAEVLSLSGYATELLLRQPAAVAWLDRYDNLVKRDPQVLDAEV